METAISFEYIKENCLTVGDVSKLEKKQQELNGVINIENGANNNLSK